MRLIFSLQLVRRVTRECFVVLHKRKWDKTLIKQLNEHIERTIRDKSSDTEFLVHYTEIFLDELAKVSASFVIEEITP